MSLHHGSGLWKREQEIAVLKSGALDWLITFLAGSAINYVIMIQARKIYKRMANFSSKLLYIFLAYISYL